jgi:hypothetical protein
MCKTFAKIFLDDDPNRSLSVIEFTCKACETKTGLMDVLAIRAFEYISTENNVQPIAFNDSKMSKEFAEFNEKMTNIAPRAVVQKLQY